MRDLQIEMECCGLRRRRLWVVRLISPFCMQFYMRAAYRMPMLALLNETAKR
jgi:hypothetical protein